MDGRFNETVHDISLCRFENNSANRRYKEQKLNEIIIAICAMLNSNGGNVVLHNECECEKCKSSQMSLVVRILEQLMISIIGLNQTVLNINFKEDKERMLILVQKSDSLITTNYNLYLPSQSQVEQVSPLEPLEKVKNDIINRKVVLEPVQLGSHCKIFFKKGKICDLKESKIVQLKHLKAGPSKRIRLADRMTGKGNKFSCYVSAFANYNGGHIYYGIKDDGVVEGELIPDEDISEIIKKAEKAINKMIWPEQIGQPIRGEHWDIFFEPVVDENSTAIPSTFVIVIYVAPCLGGVFTEEPECYEIVEGKVKKMLFNTSKKGILQKEIPHSVQRIAWSSAKARKAFTVGDEKLMQLINNGSWDAIWKTGQILERKCNSYEMKLLVLSKHITACYRRCRLTEASTILEQYNTILPKAQDRLFFEVMGLYLQAAVLRARGDFQALGELLDAALSLAELIEPGLVTAIVYVFAGTVTDLVNSYFSPEVLSIRALEHLRRVPDSSEILADMEQKAHINLATYYLGCNMSGQRIKGNIDISGIDKAKTSIMVVHQSAYDGHPLSRYREVQLNLLQSIYNYRYSQISPDQKNRFLRSAFTYAKKAECLSKDFQFTEMVKWSKANEALCTEELVRSQSFSARKSIQLENSLHE